MKIVIISACLIFLISGVNIAQPFNQQNYFSSPLDTNVLRLSGIYGELRPNHFHSGYDFKTGEVEGMKVLAAADGYVSRVNISTGGYGKSIYITHPNGYTTVYGHLQRFSGEVSKYIKTKQYENQSFTIELFPENEQFKVKKGDVIGFSGNTGSSGGPHLHFEIRETKNSIPVHPFFWGYQPKDNISPDLNGFRIYPAEKMSEIDGKKKFYQDALVKSGNKYRLKNADTILVKGKVFFGFDATDRMNETNNIFGLYKVEVLIDNELFYSSRIDSISFDETRYINSFIDFATVIRSRDWYQLTLIQPNNRLSIYSNVKNNGIIEFSDDKVHHVQIKLMDVTGNISSLTFNLKNQPSQVVDLMEFPAYNFDGNVFKYDSVNSFATDFFELNLPEDALYDTIHFRYMMIRGAKGSFSSTHQIHFETVPLHKKAILKIKPETLPDKIRSRACIVRKKDNGDLVYVGGKWDGGFLNTSIGSFGNYFIAVDTINPAIKPLNIPKSKVISSLKQLRFMISDDFSGIASFRAFLNGKWILMEYEPKDKLLFYDIDNQVIKGKNELKIEIKDNCGNISLYNTQLKY